MCKSLCRTKEKDHKVHCYAMGGHCVVRKKGWRKIGQVFTEFVCVFTVQASGLFCFSIACLMTQQWTVPMFVIMALSDSVMPCFTLQPFLLLCDLYLFHHRK
jgi:hypothetical protein